MKQKPVRRTLWLVAGLASVALGAAGVVLPILPTVPFLLLAAFCFARSNPAWEAKLLAHPRYGPSLILWREKRAIGRRGKIGATIAFAASIIIGAFALSLPWSLLPLLVAIICGGWIWTRPDA